MRHTCILSSPVLSFKRQSYSEFGTNNSAFSCPLTSNRVKRFFTSSGGSSVDKFSQDLKRMFLPITEWNYHLEHTRATFVFQQRRTQVTRRFQYIVNIVSKITFTVYIWQFPASWNAYVTQDYVNPSHYLSFSKRT